RRPRADPGRGQRAPDRPRRRHRQRCRGRTHLFGRRARSRARGGGCLMLNLWLQAILDGAVIGATISLGAIGITLTYAILRFANFAHGEFIAWGGYFALAALGAIAGWRDLSAWLGG